MSAWKGHRPIRSAPWRRSSTPGPRPGARGDLALQRLDLLIGDARHASLLLARKPVPEDPCQGPKQSPSDGTESMHSLQLQSSPFLGPRIYSTSKRRAHGAKERTHPGRRRCPDRGTLERSPGQRGLQQKDLAAKLGMEQSALSRYERGEMRLPSSLLARIARTLKVSVTRSSASRKRSAAPSSGTSAS